MDGRTETGPIGAPRAEGKPRYWTDGPTWDRSRFRDRGKAALPGRTHGLGRVRPGLLYRTRRGVRAARDPGSHRCYRGTHGPGGLGKAVSRVTESRYRQRRGWNGPGARAGKRPGRRPGSCRRRGAVPGVTIPVSPGVLYVASGSSDRTGAESGDGIGSGDQQCPGGSWNREGEGGSRFPIVAPGFVPSSRSSRRRDTGV